MLLTWKVWRQFHQFFILTVLTTHYFNNDLEGFYFGRLIFVPLSFISKFVKTFVETAPPCKRPPSFTFGFPMIFFLNEFVSSLCSLLNLNPLQAIKKTSSLECTLAFHCVYPLNPNQDYLFIFVMLYILVNVLLLRKKYFSSSSCWWPVNMA